MKLFARSRARRSLNRLKYKLGVWSAIEWKYPPTYFVVIFMLSFPPNSLNTSQPAKTNAHLYLPDYESSPFKKHHSYFPHSLYAPLVDIADPIHGISHFALLHCQSTGTNLVPIPISGPHLVTDWVNSLLLQLSMNKQLVVRIQAYTFLCRAKSRRHAG